MAMFTCRQSHFVLYEFIIFFFIIMVGKILRVGK